MKKEIIKQAYGAPVSISGDLITNLVAEVNRRMVSGGERLKAILEDLQARFKLNDREIYVLKAELNKSGIDADINDEQWFIPTERRQYASAFKTTKIAKIYGSRTEDIATAISVLKADIKEASVWLKQNETFKIIQPQVYYEYCDKVTSAETRIKDLVLAQKLTEAKELFAGYKRASILGFEEIGGTLHAVIRFATETPTNKPGIGDDEGDTAIATLDELSPESKSSDMKLDKEDDITPNTDIKSESSTFEINTSKIENFDPKKPEDVKRAIAESGNETAKSAADSVGGNFATSAEFLKKVIETIDGDDDVEQAEKETILNGLREFEGVVTASTTKLIKHADFRFPEKSLASSLMTFEKIGSIISQMISLQTVSGNIKLAASFERLNEVVQRSQDYITKKLPYADNIQKQAAAVVLKNIAKSLEDLNLSLDASSTVKEPQRGYVIAQILPKIEVIANSFILLED
jgi:hypothetical protein